MSTSAHCEKCGAVQNISEGGLCPACLMALAGAFDPLPGLQSVTIPVTSSTDVVADAEYIGPYRILEQIGEGGMGVVYRAEQRTPIFRIVAIKVVKLGMSTRDVIARFEAERQALALMNHPNIAKVFEAGATRDGRPYFVMEYVQGQALNTYCDEHTLPIRKRLELFLQACEAVHHAHQKAILHRDIKPTNLLVTSAERGPILKVIDFGVAKALSQRLIERTLFTEQGRLIGTPEYMSPEQAEIGGGADLDTRTDIYSLGVVLYELLVGTLPVDSKTLQSLGFDDLRKTIREQDPPRPSRRVALQGDRGQEASRLRRTDPTSLEHMLTHELEWIPLRSMRKERNERYRSAAELADDIRNYLEGRPLLAGPQTTSYRVRKFARKHRRAVFFVFLIVASILALTIALAIETRQAIRAKNDLVVEKGRFQQAAAQAIAAEHLTKQRMAKKLIAFGDVQLSIGQSADALQSYLQSLTVAEDMALPRASILPRLFVASEQDPLVVGSFGRSEGIGGFAGSAHVNCLALSPDGNTAITAELDKTLKLWDLRTGRRLHVFSGHGDAVNYVAISPDGTRMLSASNDGTVGIWNLSNWAFIRSFRRHAGHVFVVNFSPVDQSVLSGDERGNLLLWKTNSDEVISLPGHIGSVTAAAFSPNGERALSSGKDGTVRLWDLSRKTLICTYRGHNNEQVNDVAFSRDGRWAVSAGFDKTVRLWDLTNPADTGLQLGAHNDWVWRVAFSPDGTKVASASQDQTVRLWDLSTPGTYRTLAGQTGASLGLAFSIDGRMVAATGDQSAVRVWKLSDSGSDSGSPPIKSPSPASCSISDVGIAAVATAVGSISVYDAGTGKNLISLDAGISAVEAISLSADGRALIAGTADGTMIAWDLQARKQLIRAVGHGGGVTAVAFVGNTRAVSAGADQTIKLWDLELTTSSAVLCNNAGIVTSLAVSAQGSVVGATADGLVTLSATRQRGPIWQRRLSPENDKSAIPLRAMAVAPDGKTILAAGPAGILRLDPTNGNPSPWSGATDTTSISFLPDGTTALSAGNEGNLELWSVSTGKLLSATLINKHPISRLALSANGSQALSVAADGSVRYLDFGDTVARLMLVARAAEARATLDHEPANLPARAVMAEWFALHHFDQWAAELLEQPDTAGHSLMLGRCYWRLGQLAKADRAFRKALQNKEASHFYLNLCLEAIERSAPAARGTASTISSSSLVH